jgi:polyphosphate kinase
MDFRPLPAIARVATCLSRLDVPSDADRRLGSPTTSSDTSVIEFERRVLEEARDQRNPLLERVKFLGILGRNLDEFVTVRGRKWIASPMGKRYTRKTHALLREGHRILRRDLLPALARAGIRMLDYEALAPDARVQLDRHFTDAILPVIASTVCGDTVLADAPGLGLNFVVTLDDGRLAIVRVPDQLSSLVPAGGESYVWLDQVVKANLNAVFAGARVESAHLFRIMRDADIVLEAADADELPLRALDAVRQRETNPVLMMVVNRATLPSVVDRLARVLGVQPESIVRTREVLDLKRLWDFSQLHRADLRYPALMPQVPARVGTCLFTAIRTGDILLHHPFESFQPVIALLRQAAADPAVETICATLYRTDRRESPIVEALLDAARRGKRVCVVVELKARFDERRNAEWSRELKAAGAQVVHAPAALKVHAKMLLIERREGTHLRRYAHLSSGNYNSFTSTVYTDLAVMTCDETITADVASLFEFMTGAVQVPSMRTLLVAPFTLRSGFNALVEREIAWAQRGEAAHIILKMNALIDPAAIAVLHRASQAGVQVDLIVRGISSLRPGIPGVSDGIRIRSIVGRFLEHSRAWYFRNGGAEEMFIGSADLMPRNFERRVEFVMPLKDRALALRLRYEILDLYLLDTMSARELLPNGRYRRVAPRTGEPVFSCQRAFEDLQCLSGDAARDDRDHNRASHPAGGHAGARALCVG